MPAQILLAKKRAHETTAHSIVVGDAGFYWRELPNEAELAAALRSERFSLIIVDHADLEEDPLAYVESLRVGHKHTPVLVVSEQLALENVVRAIRVGVKDLFHPPIDLAAIVERIYAVLKPELGPSRGARLDEWRELTVQFADRATIPPLVGAERRGGGPSRRAADLLQASLVAAELKSARDALARAEVRQQELEAEVGRLGAGPKAEVAATVPGDDSLAAERTSLAEERRQVAELGRKAEEDMAGWKMSEGRLRGELNQREQALAAQARALATAQESLEVERALLDDAKAKVAEERAATGDAQATQKDIAAKLKQLVVEQLALTKAREKLAAEETAWKTKLEAGEADLIARQQAVEQVEGGVRQLAADREKFEAEKLLADEERRACAEERGAMEKQAEVLYTANEQLLADREQLAEHQRESKQSRAARELQLGRQEKAVAALQAELTDAVEQLQSERLKASQASVKAASDREEIEALRVTLDEQARELAERTSSLKAAEERAQSLAAQNEVIEAKLKTEVAALAAGQATFAREAKALVERAQRFESKYHSIREHMQELLALG